MGRYSVLGCLCGCLVAACTAPDLPNGAATVGRSDLDTFLAAAPDLHPCTAAAVSARLGIQLEVQSERRAWTFYRASGRGTIAEYGLRVPKTAAAAPSGGERAPRLVATLVDGAVRYADVSARLGAPLPDSLDVQPAGGPTVYRETFALGRNEVLVGAGLDDPRSATDIIVICR